MSPLASETRHSVAIQLPTRVKNGATSFFDALERRKTHAGDEYAPLPLQELSNLLWAACGVNRKAGPLGMPGRTAASASNAHEIDLYVAMDHGVYTLGVYAPILLGVENRLKTRMRRSIAGR